MEKYKVWTDNESKVYTSKDFENINDACEYASKFVHEHDGKPYRVICHIDDENGETVDTYENIANYNFEFEDYKRDHIAFRMNQAMSGYYRLEMYEPNTKSEIHNSVLLIDDPACEDYYDYDLAREQFEQFIEGNFNNRDLNVINRAVKEGLWLSDLKNIAPEDIVIECENNILSNEGNIIDEYTQCDIEFTNRGQYYHYIDQDDNDYTSSGDITHLGHETDYYHNEDFSRPLKWFEVDEEHRNEYTFIYDRIVDCKGNIVALYDYLS